jgi:hypothetical protein
MEIAKLIVSILGFGGTICALYFGFRQYKRAEQWKRAEFVAKEIKEFESNPTVRAVLEMIDWGDRRVNLFQRNDIEYGDYEKVTREDQWRALLPHRLKEAYPSIDVGKWVVGVKRYTAKEVKIRDSYDVFLDYLQRFGHFIEANLVSSKELNPYLRYWLELIAIADLQEEGEWRGALLSYINYYKYSGVVKLFAAYGFDISPRGKVFNKLEKEMARTELYDALLYLVQEDLFRKSKDKLFEPYLEKCKKSESKRRRLKLGVGSEVGEQPKPSAI